MELVRWIVQRAAIAHPYIVSNEKGDAGEISGHFLVERRVVHLK